ncbi:amidase [Oceanobacillus piezotolerans]|uniref:Amidase n=1 Tax=Oceanobacillus piezotolerans TaxID=2448030 RepID=A0A498DHF0_9BACI|nr:amidase family protein [Oceanobacillus piezotolerans]RLL44915.1 amidase [Oceanobacillus piezotolerans]
MVSWFINATIKELKHKLDTFEITSKQLVFLYLEQIASFNPKINAMIEINPQAVHLAEMLDYERKTTGKRGILHGIPIVIKDNIDTKDKMHTSAGSLLLKDSFAKEDAFLVKNLRRAGAIILGKTNLTEWANFIADDMPNGYSSRGGQVLNPYGDSFDVGGSSSGSGAAIAASFAAAAIGTETSGSILSPSSQNSLVGIKPTIGLISRSGVIPISHTQDTPGPMTKTVEDAAIILNVLVGQDESDPVTLSNPLLQEDFTNFLDKDGLKGKRLGIARDPYYTELTDERLEVVQSAIKVLEKLGAEIVDSVKFPTPDEDWNIDVMLYEFKRDIHSYLATVECSLGVKTLKDLIEKNKEIGEDALNYGQEIFLKAEATSGNLTDPVYLKRLMEDGYHSRENGIDAVMKKHQLDALLFPSYYGSGIAAKAGYPSITVPAGYTKLGEPIGITFTGQAFSEPELLKLAYAFEQATKHRKAPLLDKETV